MNLFKKRKNKINKPSDILSHPLHDWIREDRQIHRFFKHILTKLEKNDLEQIISDRNIIFLECLGQFSATLPNSKEFNLVLIFPNLIKEIFKANNRSAEAIIFHELGHLYHGHFKTNKSDIVKQFEADRFAYQYGYEKELIEFLKRFNNVESQIRLKEIYKLSQ